MPSAARRLVVVASGATKRSGARTIVGNACAVRGARSTPRLAHHTGQLTMVFDTFTGDAGSFDMYTLRRLLFVPAYGREVRPGRGRDRRVGGRGDRRAAVQFVGALKDEQRVVVERVPAPARVTRTRRAARPSVRLRQDGARHPRDRVRGAGQGHHPRAASGCSSSAQAAARAAAAHGRMHKQSQLDVECDVLGRWSIQSGARSRTRAAAAQPTVIVDEAHHLGARLRLTCFAPLRLRPVGDARPARRRRHPVRAGTIIHKAERVHQNVHVTELLLPAVGGTATNASGRPNFAGMINELARSRERSDLLAAHLRRLHARGARSSCCRSASSSCSTCTRRCGAAASTRPSSGSMWATRTPRSARGASRRARSPSRPSRWRARASTSRGSTASSQRRRARTSCRRSAASSARRRARARRRRSCSTPSTRTDLPQHGAQAHKYYRAAAVTQCVSARARCGTGAGRCLLKTTVCKKPMN